MYHTLKLFFIGPSQRLSLAISHPSRLRFRTEVPGACRQINLFSLAKDGRANHLGDHIGDDEQVKYVECARHFFGVGRLS